MATHHYLKIFLRDQPDHMLLPVREGVVDRLQQLLGSCQSASPQKTVYFWFETTDGKSMTLNLRYLQAAPSAARDETCAEATRKPNNPVLQVSLSRL